MPTVLKLISIAAFASKVVFGTAVFADDQAFMANPYQPMLRSFDGSMLVRTPTAPHSVATLQMPGYPTKPLPRSRQRFWMAPTLAPTTRSSQRRTDRTRQSKNPAVTIQARFISSY